LTGSRGGATSEFLVTWRNRPWYPDQRGDTLTGATVIHWPAPAIPLPARA